MKYARPTLAFLIGCLACAENRLHTYMVIQTPATAAQQQGKKRGEIELSPAPLKLTMFVPDAEELENLSEDLRLSAPSKYHRLPPLTFLRIEFTNKSGTPWLFDFQTAYFAEPSGKSYRPVTAKDYAQRFTSVAYEHFRYDAMYSAYITRRNDVPAKDSFWFEKKLPGEKIEIKNGESGFQIVPFEFIPAGVEELTFHFPVDGKNVKVLKIQLTTERGS